MSCVCLLETDRVFMVREQKLAGLSLQLSFSNLAKHYARSGAETFRKITAEQMHDSAMTNIN